MSLEYVVFALLILAAIMPAVLSYHAYRRRSVPGALLLALLLFAMAVWASAYSGELWTADLTEKVFWARLKYAAALAVPPLWVAFTLDYTGRRRWLEPRTLALLAGPPIGALALIWTNEAYGMVWRYIRSTPATISTIDAEPALWFWIIAALSYGLLALGTSLLVLNLASPRAVYRSQQLVLVCAVLIPWGANGLSLLGIGTIPDLDLTPLVFPLAAAVLGLGIWRFRLLDVSPVAREEVLENLTDGVIALDASNRVLDMNPAAERILGTTASEATGQPLARLASGSDTRFVGGRGLTTLLGRYVEEGRGHAEVSIGHEPELRHYSLILSQLGDGRHADRLLALRDTTEQKLAEDRLDRLAHYDSLTNLPNRRLFYDRLEQALAQDGGGAFIP